MPYVAQTPRQARQKIHCIRISKNQNLIEFKKTKKRLNFKKPKKERRLKFVNTKTKNLRKEKR